MSISEPTKRRLVALLKLLEVVNTQKITSVEISRISGWKDSLVRFDLKSAGISGGVSNGYDVEKLKKSITEVLGIENSIENKCCIVGLGRIGSAMLDTSIFLGSGFQIVAGFDANVNRTEILRSTFPLYPLSRLESVILAEKIEYAILCVLEKDAQSVAVRLEKCGIKGIVNYTSSVLNVGDSMKIENVSPVTALMNVSI